MPGSSANLARLDKAWSSFVVGHFKFKFGLDWVQIGWASHFPSWVGVGGSNENKTGAGTWAKLGNKSCNFHFPKYFFNAKNAAFYKYYYRVFKNT